MPTTLKRRMTPTRIGPSAESTPKYTTTSAVAPNLLIQPFIDVDPLSKSPYVSRASALHRRRAAAGQPVGQRHASGQENPDAFLDRDIGKHRLLAREDDDVAQIEVI